MAFYEDELEIQYLHVHNLRKSGEQNDQCRFGVLRQFVRIVGIVLAPFGSFDNARFPHGPSALAFALNSLGSMLNTTGPALRGLAGR
jgi:hypothetical protein